MLSSNFAGGIKLTNEQIEAFINQIKDTIDEAQKELAEVKTITENDPTEYSYSLKQLMDLEEEMDTYLTNATPEQRAELLAAREFIHYTEELMVRGI